jgi:hypothetical protein
MGENHVDANETRVIANRKQVNVRETHSKRNYTYKSEFVKHVHGDGTIPLSTNQPT